jgi:importin-4
MPKLAEATLILLREESSCQQAESDDEEDDDVNHDEVLMDAVSDLLPAFAKVMGPYFDPILRTFFEPLMKFAVSSEHYK